MVPAGNSFRKWCDTSYQQSNLLRITHQQKSLYFTWEIGCWLVDHAKQQSLPITIDIRRGTQQLFHTSRPGTSPDNDAWVEGKVRLINRFRHSSFIWVNS
ncbi:MAG: heme-binding protein [Anaerolineaceae bacterium]|nr:heme-binding protein [Anaerolineaceae bacterium]